MLLTAVSVAFTLRNQGAGGEQTSGSAAVDAVLAAVTLTFPTVGLVIVLRRPRHVVGWLFLGASVGGAVGDAALGWATYGLATDPGSLPGSALAGLVADLVWIPILATAVVLLFLVFPDGRLPRDGWRWVTRLALADVTLYVVATALNPGPLYYFPGVANPLGVVALARPAQAAVDVTGYLVPVLVIASGVALVERFRRSTGARRLQMRWLAATAGLLAVLFPLLVVVSELEVRLGGVEVGDVLFELVVSAIPVAVGVAILRHRLYDIDVVANRALVYAMLTASLVGVYLLGVLGFRTLARPLVGESDLAVAASTLLVAALFRPVRARIQLVVDRRFYRRKYDAGRTLDSFAQRLRDQVDLDALDHELRATVDRAVQPAMVTVWWNAHPLAGRGAR